MLNAKSLLDNLIGGLGQMTGGQGAKGLTDKVKATWDSQSTLGKGALAGGLLGVLLTRGGRRMLGTGIKIGSMAAIGGLAYKAYADWKTGRSGGDTQALPAPETEFMPVDAAAQDDLATRILQAMIGAAKADGRNLYQGQRCLEIPVPCSGQGRKNGRFSADGPTRQGRSPAVL